MSVQPRRLVAAFGVLAIALLASCASLVSPLEVAGDYELVSVNGVVLGDGPGAVAGAVWLRAPGLAERRITYAAPDGSRSEYVLTGTFTVAGSEIRLALNEGAHTWRPLTARDGSILTITYPSPNDGPDIVERYERQ